MDFIKFDQSVDLIAVKFDGGYPQVPLRFCPGAVMTFTIDRLGITSLVAFVSSPDNQCAAWLYEIGDDLGEKYCKARMESYDLKK